MIHFNEYRFPTKNTIKNILEDHGIDIDYIIFSADYDEGKKAGILTKHSETKKQLKDFHITFKEDYSINIRAFKYEGRIHSIWFDNNH